MNVRTPLMLRIELTSRFPVDYYEFPEIFIDPFPCKFFSSNFGIPPLELQQLSLYHPGIFHWYPQRGGHTFFSGKSHYIMVNNLNVQYKNKYLLWKPSSSGVIYRLAQPGHWSGPIPVCLFICICKERFVVNCFGHSEHWYTPEKEKKIT